MNLRPCCDYMVNIKRVNLADPLQGIVQSAGKHWQADLLPSIGHIPLTSEAEALNAAVRLQT